LASTIIITGSSRGIGATTALMAAQSSLRQVMEINVLGTMFCSQEAVRRMSTQFGGNGGAIVNITSRAAQYGSPGEFVHYAASKAAVESFSFGLATEVAAEGIRVNCVSAGLVDTELHAAAGDPGRAERFASRIPIGRAGTAEEIAQAVLWLLSDEASYCTGSVLAVTGGR
jgi:NAD(P)-dependent dehydrogenase (short-subunit alcohol dehydrogenase family)